MPLVSNGNQTLIVVFGLFATVAVLVIGAVLIFAPDSAGSIPLIITGVGSLGGVLLTLKTVSDVKGAVTVVNDKADTGIEISKGNADAIKGIHHEVAAIAEGSVDNADAIQKVHVMVNDHQTKMDEERKGMVDEVARLNELLSLAVKKLATEKSKKA